MTASDQSLDGKSFNWHPRFSEEVAMMAVAADVRPTTTQLMHYPLLAVSMHATRDELEDIVEALQFCERKHGFAKIVPALPTVTAAVENAVALTGLGVTKLGIMHQLASPGLFIGALVEQLAEIDSSTRRFPLSQYNERINSPRLEFEDCLIGASVARKLDMLREERPQDVQPFSALVAQFRIKLGARGTLLVDKAAREAHESPLRLAQFIQVVGRLAAAEKVNPPPQWRMWVRERRIESPRSL